MNKDGGVLVADFAFAVPIVAVSSSPLLHVVGKGGWMGVCVGPAL